MKHGPAIVLLLVLGTGLIFGLAQLFQWRLSSGDVFPAYSSLRDDPLGLGVLHDALKQMPELHVERHVDPLATLRPTPARTIVLAGAATTRWTKVTRDEWDALAAAVRGGSRLVIAFQAQTTSGEPRKNVKPGRRAAADQPDGDEADEVGTGRHLPAYVDLMRRWGAAPKQRWLLQSEQAALRSRAATAIGLPPRIAWASDTYFELAPDAGWQVLFERGGAPVLVERRFGAGSIVLAGDAYFLSNEALQRDRAPALLAWIVGPLAHVVFEESHLGVVAHPGIAALARRYGLWATGVSLALLALLFVWQRNAWFVPPPPGVEEQALTYHPAAGLHSLLRRSVPANAVVAASVAEWRSTAPESDRQRVDRALAAAPASASPPEIYNLLVRALRKR